MRRIRLCWSDAVRVATRGQEASTAWSPCDPDTLRNLETRREAGNSDHGVDSHWIEHWEVVEPGSQPGAVGSVPQASA